MSVVDTKPLLVEIGCEEIPARFLTDAQHNFGERLKTAFAEARLVREGSQFQTYSTPRRLVAYFPAVLIRQPDLEETLHGPSVKAAFDTEGRPTRAAESFAAKNGQMAEALFRVPTPKGEYMALRKLTPGRPAEELLGEILPAVITGVEFPKSMVWPGKKGMRFVRPIRWVLVLFGSDRESVATAFPIISGLAKKFSGTGIAAGYETRGHRSLGLPNPLAVGNFEDYAKKLRENYVEFDPAARRESVRHSIQQLLELSGLELVEDLGLEEWIVNSTEWPTAILGNFDQRFLSLPREILITVMRDHQKYFAVEDEAGNLQPSFITVLNMEGDPKGIIRHGHERVLTARFSDAEFFWNADQKIPLRDRLPMLERITYQKKLGSYGDKVRRMKAIAQELCAVLQERGEITVQEATYALRAVELSKCDLTTQMVQEFTELQGIVGGLYAAAQGEPQEVADAIYDHYRPQGAEDSCPRAKVGAVAAIADKLDTIVAGLSAGIEPSGSSDPFGLRRAGNGIVKVSVEVLPGLDLSRLAQTITAKNLGLPGKVDLWGGVAKFLRERVEYYLEAVAGLRYDTVRAVIHSLEGNGWSIPSNAARLGTVLDAVRDREEFLALSQAARRTRNILKKSATLEDFGSSMEVHEQLLTAGPERDLFNAYGKMRERLEQFERRGDYEAALLALGGLGPQVDRFFDSVLVMDENPEIRRNRLALLSNLNALVFTRLADLSEIATDSNVDASTSKVAPRKP
ncbi:MAG: glycine--tRNA ligase subunit beta [Terriglobia bacterium]